MRMDRSPERRASAEDTVGWRVQSQLSCISMWEGDEVNQMKKFTIYPKIKCMITM